MSADTNQLSQDEVKVILRAADEIIARGGRTLLTKILKGSREKKILELELDKCPVYGYFKSEKLDDIREKVDWMVNHDFLDIEYNGKLPMIIFTERGWLIQSDQYTNELLEEWMEWIKQGKRDPDMMYLKDRNREIIFLLLEKIKGSGNQSFIPYLELWKKIEYKKVQTGITKVITALEQNNPVDGKAEQERKKRIGEALEINEPQDLLLKCWICGDRFIFTVGEQQFYKKKGLSLPKRCGKCRHSYE